MIKDLMDYQQTIIFGLIQKAVFEVEQNELDYYGKVDIAWNMILENCSKFQINIDDDTEKELLMQVKEVLDPNAGPISIVSKYEPWLEKERNNIQWTHKSAYYQYLIQKKHWPHSVVYSSIDKSTDVILDHMGNPKWNRYFNTYGLVIGNVQSGKTANYTGLINKAVDAGYKLIIVLAGQQNDLRTQTQTRLDREVLGFETGANFDTIKGEKVGVGKFILNFPFDVDTLTTKMKDFNKMGAPHPLHSSSTIVVVKKNTIVLNSLIEYLKMDIVSSTNKETGERELQFPVLIIDDEVDQASINTKRNPELDPTAINKHIRTIIKMCRKSSYVGYTATPYANVLISHDINHDEYGKDLFPQDFIVVLSESKDYCGVEEFFGKSEDIDLTYVRYVDDENCLVDIEKGDDIFKIKSQDEVTSIPQSMKDAIDDYIVASAIRRSREGEIHNSMMVHIAAFVKPAKSLFDLLQDYVYELRYSYDFEYDKAINKYKDIWIDRFQKLSVDKGYVDKWEDIEPQLKNVFNLIEVKLLNGTSKSVLDYSQGQQSQIIAVGGNKLSRGITLEGLMVTYYLRDPRAYDTAMQMGRWFGYKKEYIDLCRIYSKPELISNFVRILDATNELKRDIANMNDLNLTPRDFGLRIMLSPNMLPTARNKMYGAQRMRISFSEERQELFRYNTKKIEENNKVIQKFIASLDKNEAVEKIQNSNLPLPPVFKNVSRSTILNMLREFNDDQDKDLSQINKWIEYISSLGQDNELSDWTVAISNNTKGKDDALYSFGSYKVKKANRSESVGTNISSNIRAMSNPADFRLFFRTDELKNKYLKGYVKGDYDLRNTYFTKDQCLLVVYPLDIYEKNLKGSRNQFGKIKYKDVIGLAIWFPYTDNEKGKIDYTVNSVYVSEDEVRGIYDDEEN